MDYGWQSYTAWTAYFDLLGFKNKLEELSLPLLQLKVDEIVNDFHKEVNEFEKNVDSLFYADTFIFFSKSDDDKHYPGILHGATHFLEKCISKGIALRGAISFGEIAVREDKTIVIGNAFLDSHNYAENSNWLGLILTPTASKRVKEMGLDPIRHGFIYGEIPWRNGSKLKGDVHAYSFCRGVTNFDSPLLPQLESMQLVAPEEAKEKYEQTIRFIGKHWRKSPAMP